MTFAFRLNFISVYFTEHFISNSCPLYVKTLDLSFFALFERILNKVNGSVCDP